MAVFFLEDEEKHLVEPHWCVAPHAGPGFSSITQKSKQDQKKKRAKSSYRKQELSQISLQVSSTRPAATLHSSGTMSAGIEIPHWFDKQSAAFLVCHI